MSSSDSLVDKIVAKVKAEGVFDQFRKECVSFIEDSSQYRHLKDKVGQFVEDFLKDQPWPCPIEKKKLRELLKAQLHISKLLDRVDNIVIQAVRENCDTSLLPLTKPIVEQFFPSKTNKENNNQKEHNNQKETLKEKEQVCSSEDGVEEVREKVGVSDVAAQSQPARPDSENAEKPIPVASEETAGSEAGPKISPKPTEEIIESVSNASTHKEESHKREAATQMLQDGGEPEVCQAEMKDAQCTAEETFCHDTNDHKPLNESTRQLEMANQPVNYLADVIDDKVQSVDKSSDGTPEENTKAKPTDEPESKEGSLEHHDKPPLKRRRSSRSVTLEQSSERADTISSRTRSKDTKSVTVLPPKKRARKF